ncbi:MAG: hypothetical protein K2X06_08790 [Burkholderiales bacterium]|nr:hypothetical protein [Burkholderiales bacterium]
MFKLLKRRPAESSRFSEFIREASSAEKKKVYTRVMKRASEAQNAVLNRCSKPEK